MKSSNALHHSNLYLRIKEKLKTIMPVLLLNILRKLKLIMHMRVSYIALKLYYLLKKPVPLPAGAVYDANINIMNLDTYHIDGHLHFTGDIGPLKELPVKWIHIYSQGVLLGKAPVNEINQRLTFSIEVPFSQGYDVFEFYFELSDGTKDYPGNLQLSYLLDMKEFEKIITGKSRDIVPPPMEILFKTHGNNNIEAYMNSIPRGIYKLQHILSDLGIQFEDIHAILDFGCGSGRLLHGLYAADPIRELYGTDYNDELLQWARNNLPPEIKFIKNELYPPLPFKDQQFDLIYLVSVFTHLPLDCQQKWLREFKRILKKGKILVVTLQGMAYLNYFKREYHIAYDKLVKKGYVDTYKTKANGVPGSNVFFTAHMPGFARKTLFKDWELLLYLPGGKLRNYLAAFNDLGFAGVQDIYVLTY